MNQTFLIVTKGTVKLNLSTTRPREKHTINIDMTGSEQSPEPGGRAEKNKTKQTT